MIKIIIIGGLTRDPETRTTTSGVNVCSFDVAVSTGKDEKPEYFRVSAWRQLGERCQQYLAKGKRVAVVGKLKSRTYDKDGTTRMSLDISADEVEFLSSKSEPREELPKSDVNGYVEPAGSALSGFENIREDELPF